MNTFQVHILAADKTFYDGPCVSLVVPTTDGERGILAHHSSMIAAIQPGTLRYQVPGEEPRLAAISPGMVKVENNEVLVIEEAQEALLQQRSRQEHQIAQATLARALNRLRVKNMGIGR